MVSFYIIIVGSILSAPSCYEETDAYVQVLCAWWYPGQVEVDDMHACIKSVAALIADGGTEVAGL